MFRDAGGVGLAQLERLPELISRKRDIFDWYLPRARQCCGHHPHSEGA